MIFQVKLGMAFLDFHWEVRVMLVAEVIFIFQTVIIHLMNFGGTIRLLMNGNKWMTIQALDVGGPMLQHQEIMLI